MFYRGIDQNGMCFFSQEDDPVKSEPSLSPLSKPKESIETQDDGPVSNRKFWWSMTSQWPPRIIQTIFIV